MAYLDTRELQERLEELESMERSLDPEHDEEASGDGELDDDEKTELAELRELRDEISEWQYGETLIPEDEFEDYARQLAEDLGAIPDDAQWPLTCIDWEQAARELAMDYTTVTYQGTDYYVRSC